MVRIVRPVRIAIVVLATAAVAVAVLYRGAIDPGLAIRKTALYGALGTLLLFVFAGVENVVADLVAERLGFGRSIGSWIAGGTVALAFGPLRDRLRALGARLARESEPAAAPATGAD